MNTPTREGSMYMYVCLTKTMVRYMVSCAWVHEFQTLVKKKKKKCFQFSDYYFCWGVVSSSCMVMTSCKTISVKIPRTLVLTASIYQVQKPECWPSIPFCIECLNFSFNRFLSIVEHELNHIWVEQPLFLNEIYWVTSIGFSNNSWVCSRQFSLLSDFFFFEFW